MNIFERLARRICWLEFATKRKDTTEARYWVGVHPAKKAEYIEDARWWAWMADRLSERSLYLQYQARLELRRLNAEAAEQRKKRKKPASRKV